MRKTPVVALASLLVGLALLVGHAGATTPQTATLVVMRTGDLAEIGWNATFPEFTDSGSWTSDFAAFGGGMSPVFAGLLKTTETGTHGNFATNWQVLDNGVFDGTCQVSGLTGQYVGLHGAGSWTFREHDGTRFYTCVTAVHWD
jgi:hypothetical protein